MKKSSIFALLIALSLLTACAQPTLTVVPPLEGTPTAVPTGSTGYPEPTTNVGYPGPTAVPSEVSPTPTHLPVDLTPAQMAAIQLVAKKYSLAVDQIQIASTEPVTWDNGCLGVTQGVMCTDMITPGFRIILSANGSLYEVHTNQDGSSAVDATQQISSVSFVVYTAERTIQVVNPDIPIGATYNPAFNGMLPTGGAILGTAYVLDFIDQAKVVAITAQGSHDLSFIQNPSYGLAIWRGGENTPSMLAWGTQVTADSGSSSLEISAPDGSQQQTLLTITSPSSPGALQIVAEFWSADGQSVYFSKEPVGIGGYILFSGASNLYKIDIKTKEVTEIIPLTDSTKPQICLDAISGDYQFVADHCTQNVITVRNLTDGSSATIQPPADIVGYHMLGSARFSPSGDRVAYALAQGTPDDERGWVAVGDTTGGVSTLVLAGEEGSYYTVLGWLDDQTLLVQANSINCPANCTNQLFTVGADGSNPTKVADGSLLAIIDNR